MAKGDMMLPVKTDKDVIRYLREALKIQEHNTNNMAAKYCKIYKMYKAYRKSKRQASRKELWQEKLRTRQYLFITGAG